MFIVEIADTRWYGRFQKVTQNKDISAKSVDTSITKTRKWYTLSFLTLSHSFKIVGCIAEHEDKILLCKRGIEPCRGRWTLPAGFLELGESSADGAMRETLEEANAKVSIISMFSMIDIPVIGQSYILFRAKLTEPIFHKPGPETLQTKLFHPTEIPFDQVGVTH